MLRYPVYELPHRQMLENRRPRLGVSIVSQPWTKIADLLLWEKFRKWS